MLALLVLSSSFLRQFWSALRRCWHGTARKKGALGAASLLVRNLWNFVHESTPERRRQRYGDMEFDWEHRVDTTSGTVEWRTRLLGLFGSPYQPTDPNLFHEMMSALAIDYQHFTFLDIGSGKGRTLLMASEYPFRRILGIELLPELHQVAQANLAQHKSARQKCFLLETICGDAANFSFPAAPLLVYLFDPLPESGLGRMLDNLERSLSAHPRTVYVLYHNPVLEQVLRGSAELERLKATERYCVYVSRYASKSRSLTFVSG